MRVVASGRIELSARGGANSGAGFAYSRGSTRRRRAAAWKNVTHANASSATTIGSAAAGIGPAWVGGTYGVTRIVTNGNAISEPMRAAAGPNRRSQIETNSAAVN